MFNPLDYNKKEGTGRGGKTGETHSYGYLSLCSITILIIESFNLGLTYSLRGLIHYHHVRALKQKLRATS